MNVSDLRREGNRRLLELLEHDSTQQFYPLVSGIPWANVLHAYEAVCEEDLLGSTQPVAVKRLYQAMIRDEQGVRQETRTEPRLLMGPRYMARVLAELGITPQGDRYVIGGRDTREADIIISGPIVGAGAGMILRTGARVTLPGPRPLAAAKAASRVPYADGAIRIGPPEPGITYHGLVGVGTHSRKRKRDLEKLVEGPVL